jgi:hypothetical protein
MALSNETSKQIFVCTGGTVYTIPFYFLQDSDLTVYREDAAGDISGPLTLTTDYTLTGAGSESGGELTTVATYSDGKLIVVRDVDYTQRLDLIQGDGFRPDTLEQELDRIVMQIQQLSRQVGVSFKLPDSDTSGANTDLPHPEAGKVLGWNETGDAVTNETPQYTIVENGSIVTEKLAKGAVTLEKIDADATSVLKGVMRFATDADTQAGEDTAAAVTPASLNAASVMLGASHYGLNIANGTDASHDIDISAGACRDSTNQAIITLATGLTKQIDAAWSEGTDAGGFPSGLTLETSVADRANSTAYSLGDLIKVTSSPWWWECTTAGTSASSQPSGYAAASATVTDGTAVFTRTAPEWYRVFIISSSDLSLIDAGFDSDASATNLLSDASSYSLYRQIGWVLNDGAGNIVNFHADECGMVVWDTIQLCRALSVDLSTSAVETMIVSPPDTVASLNVTMDIPGAADSNRFGLLTETRQTDTAASDTAYTLRMKTHTYGPQQESIEVELKVDSDSKIRTRGSDGDIGCGILCKGYKYLWD